MRDELVRSPEEDFAWPVLAEFAAQRTRDRDGLEREFLSLRRHVAAASLALHDEGLAARGGREHGEIIGKYKAKIYTWEEPNRFEPQIAWNQCAENTRLTAVGLVRT